MTFSLSLSLNAELEVRRYTPVWYTGSSLVGLKSYRHFFLADCHTGMQCTKFGQLIVGKTIKIVASRLQMHFLGAKCAKNVFAAGAPPDPLAGFKGPTSKGSGGQGQEQGRRRGEGGEGKGKE